MSSTFVELCNNVLRRLNEVEINSAEFGSVRGIQALTKDAITTSIAKINQAEYSWPFNASEYTQTLVVGQEEYSWPSLHKVTDWNSFQIQKDDTLGVTFKKLNFISLDEYFERHRNLDDNTGTSGRGVPDFIFPSGNGWGLTPSPDKAYQVKYRYYQIPATLSVFTDTSRIPSQYENVIIDGAMFQMYLFKDNSEAAQIVGALFEQGVKQMQSQLINNYDSIRDRRVVQGINTDFFSNA